MTRLDQGCMLLGILPDVQVSETVLSFHQGDVLFMFTDGVVEQSNEEEEMYSSERIVEELKRIGNLTAEQLVLRLQDKLMAFAGGHSVDDAITMLGVKF
mgnify:CR=1 FL=1